MSQIFRSFEANSGDYLTKMIGKSDQKGFSAVGSLFSDRLLDNACKWAASKVTCRVSGNEEIRILIEDDGAGLTDQDLERLTQRGARLDETVEGHGLGLAIAKDIVKLYGGTMQFGRSPQLGGLQIQVVLPQVEHIME